MSRAENELDEFGKRALAPLRSASPIDLAKAGQIKSQFLAQAESFRQDLATQLNPEHGGDARRISGFPWLVHPSPLLKAAFAVLIALVIVLASSGITVFAAQDSLPGDRLYPLKTWSENLRYSLTFSTQSRLNLTLDYTNSRVNEISSLVAQGRIVSDQTSDQYQQELNNALELAAQMNDTQLESALQQIMSHAGKQEMIVQRLIGQLPPQAQPAMRLLQERLQAQLQLSALGKADPKTFRMEIQERLQRQNGPGGSPGNQQPGIGPGFPNGTPAPNEGDSTGDGYKSGQSTQMPQNDGDGNKFGQPTEGPGDGGDGNKYGQPNGMPGNGGSGNGQGQPMPGNDNQQPYPTDTAQP